MMFKKFAYQFHSLKTTFEKSKTVRITHFKISVGVNAAEIISPLIAHK